MGRKFFSKTPSIFVKIEKDLIIQEGTMTITQSIVLTLYFGSIVLFWIGVAISPTSIIKDGVSDIISWVIAFVVYTACYWLFFIWLDIQFGFLKWF